MTLRRSAGIGTGAAISASVLFAPGADAATFTVTNLNDAGAGSLRDAIQSANSNGPEDDTIVFQSGLTGTITLTSGELPIFEGGSVDIQGPGAAQLAISGQDLYRIFHAYNGTGDTVSISGLTLRDGFAGASGGGAVQVGLNPHDAVTLTGVVITGSYASDNGGAIRNEGADLSITDSSVSGNESAQEGGAVYSDGGTLSITRSTFDGNLAADEGGAIHVEDTDLVGDTVVIRESALTANTSEEEGGGIHLDDPDGDTLISATTVSGNRATPPAGTGYGGGLNADYLGPDEDLTIDSSTISGNFARFGGGVYFGGLRGDLTVTDSTISGNDAAYAGGAAWLETYNAGAVAFRNSTVASNTSGYYGAGIYFDDDSESPGEPPVALSSTIVADNADGDAASDFAPDLDQDPSAPGFDVGFSLVEDAEGADSAAILAENPSGSNILGVDPALGPLADNGGPTRTHLPALGSPVLDAGVANGLATDQRGLARTFDAANIANRAGSDATDIGAVERVAEGTCKGRPATILFEPGLPITGTEGDDVIVGTAAADQIDGGGGNDTICGGDGDDDLDGGAGNDALEGEAGADALAGGAGKDALGGGAGNDTARGGAGKDNLKGGGGKDRLKGNGGKDKLSGQAGKDKLKGGGGRDRLKGGAGKDKLVGGPGRDRLKGGPGKDVERQ